MYSVRNLFNIFGCLTLSLSTGLFAHLPVRLCLCQPVPLSVCLFVSLSDVASLFEGRNDTRKGQLIEQNKRELDGERVIEREREGNEKNKWKRLWTWTEQETKTLHDWQERKHNKTNKKQTDKQNKWQNRDRGNPIKNNPHNNDSKHPSAVVAAEGVTCILLWDIYGCCGAVVLLLNFIVSDIHVSCFAMI